MEKFSEFKYISTYYIAAGIREKIIKNDPKDYVADFFDPQSQEKQYLTPSKTTLLHDYIIQEFAQSIEYSYKFYSYDESVNEFVNYLKNYHVPYILYSDFLIENSYEPEIEEYEYYSDYVPILEKLVVEKVVPLVAAEVFSILFRDRKLLMEFNTLLAKTISDLKVDDYPDLLVKDGCVARCMYWQEWVKRALYYRDQGSCAICLNDLSGLLKVNFDRAIDHIVPLKMGGTNDITNLQILCEACNLKKLDHTIQTSEMYSRYF